jgi:hypothetical protein
MVMPVSTTVKQKPVGVINMKTEHIYESTRDAFLAWDIWVITFGTDEEIDLHQNPNGNAEDKEVLYQKWIKDQQIISLVTTVDGVIVQTMEWDPESM